jgi:type I restriction enzyme S subunit
MSTSRPLGDVCTFRSGGTPSKSNAEFWGGDIPWVSPKDMKVTVLDSSQDFITMKGVEGSATSLVPTGSILTVVRSGILAHSVPFAIAGRPLAFNQDIKAIQVTGDQVTSDYIYWFLRSKESEILARGVKKGATVHSLQSGFLEKLVVPILPKAAQQQIADLLARAQNIVKMRREAENKAEEIIPALFLDMFGDPAKNPKRWEVRKLGQIAEVVSGVAKGRRLNGKSTREVPYLRVANVQAGHLNLVEMKTIPATESEIADLAVQPGDVLMTEGGDHDKLGRGALLDHNIGECIHQNHVFRVRCDATALSPEYFVSYLQTEAAKSYFLKSAKKTTNLASINMTQLKALPIAQPALAEQTEFAQQFKACRQLESDQIRAAAIAVKAFQSLLARLFGP